MTSSSEVEPNGIRLDDIEVGDSFDIETNNRHYTIERREDGMYISGHPSYCGIMTKCYIHGSCPSGWGGMKPSFIGLGMHLDFSTDEHVDHILTSAIKAITKIP